MTTSQPLLTNDFCLACGKSIVGLSLSSVCSDCGQSVEVSVRTPLLARGSPCYRRSVLHGCVLLIATSVGAALAWVLSPSLPPLIASFICPVLAVLGLLGVLSLMAADGAAPLPRGFARLRRLAVSLGWTHVVVGVAWALGHLAFDVRNVGTPRGPRLSEIEIAVEFLPIVSFVFTCVQGAITLVWARWLARRVPDRALDISAPRMAAIMVILAVAGAGLSFLGVFAMMTYGSWLAALRRSIISGPRSLDPGLGVARAAAPRAAGNISCRKCGYSLVGLTSHDVCPECAEPVATSMSAAWAFRATPRVIRQLHRGLGMMRIAVMMTPLVLIFSVCLGLMVEDSFGLNGSGFAAFWLTLLVFDAFCFASVSIMNVTSPGAPDRDSPAGHLGTALFGTAWNMAASVLMFILAFFTSFEPNVGFIPPVFFVAVFSVLAVPFWVIGLLIQFLAMQKVLAKIATAFGSEALATQVRWQRVRLPIIFVVGAPLAGIGPIFACLRYASSLGLARSVLAEALSGTRGRATGTSA
ncbi:MAG: hypothetical protein ACK5WB_10900 [Phycisphaerales bacterium]|jgi:hypothetical protein|nr:hypothetical protein [Phycisphaeraceae bacterium]